MPSASDSRLHLDVSPLSDQLAFGARIGGVTLENLKEETVRQHIRDVFEDRGVIVFEDIEQSPLMHVTLSKVFGSLKQFPLPSVSHVEDDIQSGIIDMTYTPDKVGARQGTVEVRGQRRYAWLPWHFDHCYVDQLNRGGVLRASVVPPEGGHTLFSDGILLYELLSPELRERIEGSNIIYSMKNVPLDTIRFGRPDFRLHYLEPGGHAGILKQAESTPRAIHPAVWQRDDGRKVLHLCGYFACGIQGNETPEGDELLDQVCKEVNRLSDATGYRHVWKGSEMLIWDNWRVLHQADGTDPRYTRSMQRTTILGDYGLGYYENSRSENIRTQA